MKEIRKFEEAIVTTCRENSITEFTISSIFSSLIETISKFEKQGCHMTGLSEVKALYSDWQADKNAITLPSYSIDSISIPAWFCNEKCQYPG